MSKKTVELSAAELAAVRDALETVISEYEGCITATYVRKVGAASRLLRKLKKLFP